MTSAISVVQSVGAGGRALLLTADSIGRQRAAGVDLTLVKSAEYPDAPLVGSVAARQRALVVEGEQHPGVALNRAVRASAGEFLAILPSGVVLPRTFLERCELELRRNPEVAALAPGIRVQTADGLGTATWRPAGLDAAACLTDPASVPPAFVVRRSAWAEAGEFDEALAGLAEYEFWLRLTLSGRRLDPLREPLLVREAGARTRPSAEEDERYLDRFRAVLTRHEAAIAAVMHELLVARELRFGRTREAHRDLLVRRDEGLAELDRLRAEAAHHRAYLEHHGQSGVDWGDLRRTDPLSRDWGYDRGVPVDRHYIDEFMAAHSSDVHGAVLEVQEDDFTRAFGGPRVTRRDVLDIDASNTRATILADLRCQAGLASEAFDCIILTQTLHVIDDIGAALSECHRILKPGGVLLATLPAVSRTCLEYGEEGDFWRMTPAGAKRLVDAAFVPSQSSFEAFGNVLTNTAFLHGFAAAELTEAEFASTDPYYPALTGIRARKTDAPGRAAPRGLVLLYHRLDDLPDAHDISVPPALFEAHLKWLRAHCTLMPLDEMLRTAPEALPERPVAITFDDGYLDNLTVAAPLLRRHDAPATFFVTSRWLESPGEYWWDTLERSLLYPAALPDFLTLDIGGAPVRLPARTPEDRTALHARLHGVLVHAHHAERDRIVRTVLAWSGVAEAETARRPLLAAELRELSQVPRLDIGAHTINHLALPDQPADVQDLELSVCRSALESAIGRPIHSLAYPYGAVDRHIASVARRSFSWALSCAPEAVGESFDAALVPRIEVKSSSADDFSRRVEQLFAGGGQGTGMSITRLPD